jgi:phage shock protein PspC (stress-responsive transcriptional regulator)
MQRILQINIAGRILPIEEDAYTILKEYINTLERQFRGEDGREIIEDIENRIAELFTIRLQSGSPAIDRSDVQKVIDTLGTASDLHDGSSNSQQGQHSDYQSSNRQYSYNSGQRNQGNSYNANHDRVLRDPYDKVIGGVCSGIAHYFGIDPVIIRLIMVVLFLTVGIGFVAYIIAWIAIPAAKSREELYNINNGNPVTFHDISSNVQSEMQDLKKRGEQMSRELKDFFSKKK